jgi:hypothetical protein
VRKAGVPELTDHGEPGVDDLLRYFCFSHLGGAVEELGDQRYSRSG